MSAHRQAQALLRASRTERAHMRRFGGVPARCLVLGLLALSCAMPAGPGRAQTISAMAAQAEASREPSPAAPSAEAAPAPRASAPAVAASEDIPVPVPAVTIFPGDVITAGMLTERMMPQSAVARSGTMAGAPSLIGKAARRLLVAGQPIPLNSVSEVPLVTKGTATRVRLEEGGLSISGYATALESGVAGAVVRLKNMDSGQTILGVVQTDGSVRVSMK
ncbi:flagellar basal body P-ring formation chaperone FlgA [Roseixanthobacter glucoisosaccharinicivorans]|uniref:flagellar basal body P-ring formation chaperone FlgA n=1 Tax=Roseixanthobacter glucoisosaccharinicivorans TaxID=3119923 RepID=UPI003729AC22